MGAVAPATIEVRAAGGSYPVVIGAGVRHQLAGVIAGLGAGRVALVSARPEEWLPDAGVPTTVIRLDDGERGKTLTAVEELCERFAEVGLSRADAVVSCGGGSTTDLVGLGAALYHRGVPVVHLPTTLLAQVDASVGGKTGVNLRQGKNLVGTYWQPAAVLCDQEFLTTLPERELSSGYGELARCHFIGEPGLYRLPLVEQVRRSVALKARVVELDERDGGLRHILNYGHTLGHALETATGFELRHGEAVAIGTVFAGRLAGVLGRITAARVAEHREVVASYRLPVDVPAGLGADELIGLMRRDKKATRGLSFVLDGPSGAELVHDVPEEAVRTALFTV